MPAPTARPWLFAALFALAHTQGPVPYSNQNQYLLHGLAAAGVGDLAGDWLASTADPTPLFSLGVEWGYRLAGAWPVHAAFALLLAGYFVALWNVVRFGVGLPAGAGGRLALAAGIVASHAAVWRALSVQLTGIDYPWYLQTGVANQYLLGPGLQPSAFGVFLLVGVALYGAGRPLAAALALAAACWLHSTYLLPAALVTVGMMADQFRRTAVRAALGVGTAALLGVAPVLLYVAATFRPADPATFQSAQEALAWLRIPHHADIGQWLDAIAAGQLALVALGLWLARRSPAGRVLAVAAAGAVLLTVAQVISGSATLALMFPWRLSALLVPVAAAWAWAAFVLHMPRFWEGAAGRALSGTVLAASAVGAVWVYAGGLGYQTSRAELDLIRAVAETRRPGDAYLLPTSLPKPPFRRGAASSTFVPVPPSDRPSVFEMQRFRLGSGAAAYVDFKSVPYRDVEVLEWLRRVGNSERWYALPAWDADVLAELRREGVTHAVVPTDANIQYAEWVEVRRTPAYAIYRLPGGAP